jgi:hypothetical protein
VFVLAKLLLIGTGQAHLSILHNLKKARMKNIEVMLISSDGSSEDISVLCEMAAISFIEDTVISFDPLQKMVLCFSGEIHQFDVISFDIDLKGSLFKQALVPVNADGSMLVEDTLQNKDFPFLFGAGSSVTIAGHLKNLNDKAEQGDVLWKNVKRYLSGKRLKPLNDDPGYQSKTSFLDNWLGRLFRK